MAAHLAVLAGDDTWHPGAEPDTASTAAADERPGKRPRLDPAGRPPSGSPGLSLDLSDGSADSQLQAWPLNLQRKPGPKPPVKPSPFESSCRPQPSRHPLSDFLLDDPQQLLDNPRTATSPDFSDPEFSLDCDDMLPPGRGRLPRPSPSSRFMAVSGQGPRGGNQRAGTGFGAGARSAPWGAASFPGASSEGLPWDSPSPFKRGRGGDLGGSFGSPSFPGDAPAGSPYGCLDPSGSGELVAGWETGSPGGACPSFSHQADSTKLELGPLASFPFASPTGPGAGGRPARTAGPVEAPAGGVLADLGLPDARWALGLGNSPPPGMRLAGAAVETLLWDGSAGRGHCQSARWAPGGQNTPPSRGEVAGWGGSLNGGLRGRGTSTVCGPRSLAASEVDLGRIPGSPPLFGGRTSGVSCGEGPRGLGDVPGGDLFGDLDLGDGPAAPGWPKGDQTEASQGLPPWA